ncbi:MAG TPA: serine hydrolase [Ktedonobacterales bacterium]|nr:serine hydrolase [Ktedonobacterales bacterium]
MLSTKKELAIRGARWWQTTWVRRFFVAFVLTSLWAVPLLTVNAWVGAHTHSHAAAQSLGTPYRASSGWLAGTQTHAASFAFAAPAPNQGAVDPVFQAYYAAAGGAQQLGAAITSAFPTSDGWLQFFSAGALLLPKAGTTPSASTNTTNLYADGVRDTATGVIRLPLTRALLASGSVVPVGGDTSTLTYADLRAASRPDALISDPESVSTSDPQGTPSSVFIPESTSASGSLGHLVPMGIWSYLTSAEAAPDGWQIDFGDPLSEALPVTATVQGSIHHLLVQVFWRGIVVEDRGVTDADGDPVVTRLGTGLAYLRTFGPPSVTVRGGTPIWGLADVAPLTTPDTGAALAHVSLNFPFTATGDTLWTSSGLWYHVRWQTSHSQGAGWAPAIAVTFSKPAAGSPWWASFDALSPDLASYLTSQGQNASAVVYDLTRGQYYTYNASGQFIMASSAKVPIMLTFLAMTEAQNREPDDNEMYLLTTMIENSDNDSAQALFDEIGGAPAMSNFLSSVGVGGIAPNPDGWGYSTTTPMAMVQLLTLLRTGKVLTAQDRGLALNLMENVESDQQTGVGDTAPAGATVALKDGWVPGPDNLWAMNSSGIVTLGSETYIIAVYTQEQNQLQDGWTITEHVCGGVGQLLE